jgi:hypothetical protein
MTGYKKSPFELSVEELDRELVSRGGQDPDEKKFAFSDEKGTPARDAVMAAARESYRILLLTNGDLDHIGTLDLAKVLIMRTRSAPDCLRGGVPDNRSAMDFTRGSWSNDLMDFFEIYDEEIQKNVGCTAAICLKESLVDTGNGMSMLKVKNYGKTFNLYDAEPFGNQPVSAGRMLTGFLVGEDIVATAAHGVNEKNVADLRILFDYKMVDSTTSVEQFPNDHIYRGVKIIHRVYNPGEVGPDWALVKLDRNVAGQRVAVLSGEKISPGQVVYVIGHPLGLPLKYAAGGFVCDLGHEGYFGANLNIYSGNSGSPLFDLHTHEVVGIVTGGENMDFRWTGEGWMSVSYPDGKRADCTGVSEFTDIIRSHPGQPCGCVPDSGILLAE